MPAVISPEQAIEPNFVNLNRIVKQSAELLVPVLDEHIQLRSFLATDLLSVEIDPNQIVQILMKLAVNARDAMHAGGILLIQTENRMLPPEGQYHPDGEHDSYVVLTVRDTRYSTDAERKVGLFDALFAIEDGLGAGLGLATVHRIVKENRGFISVDSDSNQGATIKICLPAVNPCPGSL